MFLSNVSTFPMLVNYRIYSGRSYFSIGGGILNWHIYTNYKILGGDSIEGSGILLTARFNYTFVARNGLFLGVSFTPFY